MINPMTLSVLALANLILCCFVFQNFGLILSDNILPYSTIILKGEDEEERDLQNQLARE